MARCFLPWCSQLTEPAMTTNVGVADQRTDLCVQATAWCAGIPLRTLQVALHRLRFQQVQDPIRNHPVLPVRQGGSYGYNIHAVRTSAGSQDDDMAQYDSMAWQLTTERVHPRSQALARRDEGLRQERLQVAASHQEALKKLTDSKDTAVRIQ
jgi:hypothetical protein